MPMRRSHKRDSSVTDPLNACSHTRDVADSCVAQFYLSSVSRKTVCRLRRSKASAAPGAGLLRAPWLTAR